MNRSLGWGTVLLLALLFLPHSARAQAVQPAIQAAITIDIPLPNEVVSPVQVVVQGTGSALPENSVVVQALDSAGSVLAQQATTVSAELGGSGPWSVVLDLNTTGGTTGQIVAFSTSPADGSTVAQAAVAVTYGQQAVAPEPPQAPEIEVPIAPTATQAPEVEIPIVPTPTQAPEIEVPIEPTPTQAPEIEVPIEPTPTQAPELPATPTATPTTGVTAVPPIGRPATIQIHIPLNGEQVSPVEVVVVGDGANLPENNVVVEALAADGTLLDRQATTVNAPLGGAGEWRATLRPAVAPGTNGSIVAYSTSPVDGNTLAQDAVSVTYGAILVPTATATSTPSAPQAAISISIPQAGEVVSPVELVVVGTGSALPENNVVVQALDTRGAVLDQQATIADAPLGGSGEWRATLQPQVVPGTAGRIYAFSRSPADGRILADASVPVIYGNQAPVAPEIVIAVPTNGQVVNATSGFDVSGTAVNVFENNVVVRVRDQFGRTIQQGVTTADASGQWVVGFRFLIANRTPGSIYAFATSPVDGSVSAEDSVNVTYASNCTPRTDWPIYVVRPGDTTFTIARSTGTTVGEIVLANCLPNPNSIYVGQRLFVPRLPSVGVADPVPAIAIEDPAIDDALPINTPFTVSGVAADLPVGHLTVRLLDHVGAVIDEQPVTVPEQPASDEAEWAWEVDLLAPDIRPGSRGTLFAYSLSPVDGTIIVADAIDILFGADDGAPFVTIADPLPYSVVESDGNEITVSGRGRGLFENNVVVRAIDAAGNELALVPTTMQTDEVGGEGVWEATLPIDVITRGRLIASSPSPAEGDEAPLFETEAVVDVIFGQPTELESYTVFTYPLPNTVFTNQDNFYAVAGYAGGLQNENVNVIVLDEEANVRLWMPVAVDSVTDFWSAASPADDAIEVDEELSLRVFSPSKLDGSVIASDRISVVAKRNDVYVTGNVVYLQRSALPEDAVVSVRLLNASLADAPPEQTTLGTQILEQPGQVPIPFAVSYSSEEINEKMMYSIGVRIEDGQGNLLFITKQSVPVITNDNPTSDVEVLVEPAN